MVLWFFFSIFVFKSKQKIMETMKSTELGKSYWNKTGVYQEDYDKLYKIHVPSNGNAETLNGELIRSISRLYYEYCNNGNCNASECSYKHDVETCSTCNGTGELFYGDEEKEDCDVCCGSGQFDNDEEIDDAWVTELYANFLRLIKENIPSSKENDDTYYTIIDIITDYSYGGTTNNKNYFSDNVMHFYNKMCDNVIYYVLNNEDKDLPEWYLNTTNCKD